MHRARLQHRRSFAAQRGAVMVEAALVLPLLVVFLGLMTFFHRAYKEKIRVRAEARELAFDAASRACPSGASALESSFDSGSSTSQLSHLASRHGDGTSSVMSFDHGAAQASRSATVSWNTAYGPWSKTLKPATSYVYCNEKGVNTDASSWFSWATGEFGSQ